MFFYIPIGLVGINPISLYQSSHVAHGAFGGAGPPRVTGAVTCPGPVDYFHVESGLLATLSITLID